VEREHQHQITLRPVQPADELFLFELYASTRADELAALAWDAATRQLFLRQQFQAQQAHYQSYYPTGDHQIICVAGVAAGRIYIERSVEKLHLLDIALLPAQRGRGIGGALMEVLLAETAQAALPVTLYVYRFDQRVLGWYERLGFAIIGDTGMYYLMERRQAA